MAGSKTRFGFAGGSEPPDGEDARAARTVYGHDIHLQMPPDFVPPGRPPAPAASPPAPIEPATRPPVAVRVAESSRVITPVHPRQSRLARFLGRWSRSGRFEPRAEVALDDRDDLQVPRDTAARNVAVVLLVAALAFAATVAFVKLRQRGSVVHGARAASPVTSPPPLAPAARPLAPAPPPPAAAPLPQPRPTLQRPDPVQSQKGLGSPPSPPARRHPRQPTSNAAEPPQHLKGELLPMGP